MYEYLMQGISHSPVVAYLLIALRYFLVHLNTNTGGLSFGVSPLKSLEVMQVFKGGKRLAPARDKEVRFKRRER